VERASSESHESTLATFPGSAWDSSSTIVGKRKLQSMEAPWPQERLHIAIGHDNRGMDWPERHALLLDQFAASAVNHLWGISTPPSTSRDDGGIIYTDNTFQPIREEQHVSSEHHHHLPAIDQGELGIENAGGPHGHTTFDDEIIRMFGA